MIFRYSIVKLKNGEKLLTILLKTFEISLILFLCVHFFILALHQLPENPIQHQYKYELKGYIDPFFSQAWTLFAPNPINSNMSLLLRFESIEGEKRDTTNWIDITEPLIEMHNKHFWSPVQRINKFTQSCMSDVNDNHNLIIDKITQTDSLKNDTIAAEKFYAMAINLSHGHQSIVQYAQYVGNRYYTDIDKKPDSFRVQYKIFTAKFPRFSKRKEDYYDLEKYEFTQMQSDFIEIKN